MEGIVQATKRAVRMANGRRSSGPVAATVEVSDLMRQWWEEERTDRFGPWAWVCEIFIDPQELIIDDGDGALFRQPYTIDGDTVTFEDATSVKRQYVNARHVAASERGGQAQLATYASREDAVCATFTADEITEEGDVKLSKKILAKLGLDEGASPEDIEAKLEEALPDEEETETPPAPAPAPTPEPAPAPAPEPTPAPVEASKVPAGFKLVDEDAWNATQQRLAKVEAGAQLAAQRERDEILKGAVKAGKFPPASLPKYQALWDTDPEGTKSTVASLAAGTIPVNARSVAEEDAFGDTGGQAYPTWLKPETPSVAASAGGAVPTPPPHVRQYGGLTVINA